MKNILDKLGFSNRLNIFTVKSKTKKGAAINGNTKNIAAFARPGALVAVLCGATLLLAGITPQPLSAGREIVSNIDCVVEPSLVVKLGSAVPGILESTQYDRSDYVSEGSLMATLDSRLEQATLAIAEELALQGTSVSLRKASAEFGQRTLERNAELLRTSAISKHTMDQVETESRIAELQVKQELEGKRLAVLEAEQARVAVERRQIISPIDGTVVERFLTKGEYVDNDPVFEVAQLDPLHVEVIVPLEYLGQIESGMLGGIQLVAPGFEDRTLEAEVRRIDAISDAASDTFGVRLVLENPDLTVPSGVRCQVDFFAS